MFTTFSNFIGVLPMASDFILPIFFISLIIIILAILFKGCF